MAVEFLQLIISRKNIGMAGGFVNDIMETLCKTSLLDHVADL